MEGGCGRGTGRILISRFHTHHRPQRGGEGALSHDLEIKEWDA